MRKKLLIIIIVLGIVGSAYSSYMIVRSVKNHVAQREMSAEIKDLKNSERIGENGSPESGKKAIDNTENNNISEGVNSTSVIEILKSKKLENYERLNFSSAEDFISSYRNLISDLDVENLTIEKSHNESVGGMIYFYTVDNLSVITREDGSLYQVVIKGSLEKDRVEVNMNAEDKASVSESGSNTIISDINL